MSTVKISGDVTYPETGSRWVDSEDDSRTLVVEAVDPGDRLGREIRGTLHDGRPYATDFRTFAAVWLVKS